MICKELAARLRAERARMGITLREAGERSGVHYGSIYRYENEKLPTIDALYRLAVLYGVEATALLPPNQLILLPPTKKKGS